MCNSCNSAFVLRQLGNFLGTSVALFYNVMTAKCAFDVRRVQKSQQDFLHVVLGCTVYLGGCHCGDIHKRIIGHTCTPFCSLVDRRASAYLVPRRIGFVHSVAFKTTERHIIHETALVVVAALFGYITGVVGYVERAVCCCSYLVPNRGGHIRTDCIFNVRNKVLGGVILL